MVVPLLYNLLVGPLLLEPHLDNTVYALTGLGGLWIATLGLILLVRSGEGQSLASIGWRGLSWKWGLAAIGIFEYPGLKIGLKLSCCDNTILIKVGFRLF